MTHKCIILSIILFIILFIPGGKININFEQRNVNKLGKVLVKSVEVLRAGREQVQSTKNV